MASRPASSSQPFSQRQGAEQPSDGSPLPLEGVTVADFSWVLAGPRATSWLGSMGARVIKIEGPRRPDQYRFIKIFEEGMEGDLEASGAFHPMNYSKLGTAIDFNDPRGLELAKQIVAISDVVIENFAYGVIDRVGLGYEELKKIKPDIIFVSSSAMGRTGPDRDHIAYGQLLHAYGGLDSITGYEGEAGSTGGTYADPVTGTTTVLAILAALWRRKRTGRGQRIDVSMVESVLMQLPEHVLDWTANHRAPVSRGNDRPIAAPHDTFPTLEDNTWVAIAVENEQDWQAFTEAIGSPSWTRDERFRDQPSRYANRAALYDLVAAWTRTLTATEAADLLQAAGVAAGPVHNSKDMYEYPQFQERGMIVELDHPVVGRKPVIGLPYVVGPEPAERYWPAPTLGQHTDYILQDILGLNPAEVASLKADGVVV